MRIDSAEGKQFFMFPAFSDLIIGHDENLIRVADRGETMRDRDGGAVCSQLFQTLLNPALTLIVQRAGGLIKNQDRRVLQEDARN